MIGLSNASSPKRWVWCLSGPTTNELDSVLSPDILGLALARPSHRWA